MPGIEILSELPTTVTDTASNDLEAAVHQYARTVFRVAYCVLRNHHDAEDAVQETFLRLWRYRKDWAGVRDRRAWLARLAWRVALDRRRPPLEISLDDVAGVVLNLRAAGASAEDIAARREMAVLLERLIVSLPKDLKDVLTLSTVEELTSPEIALVLDIPEGSVRTRLMRAREMVKAKLAATLERKNAGQK
jgi:RNA polymerase sigma-70 factor, ECF subfamily